MNVFKPVLSLLICLLLLLGLSACASMTNEDDLRLIPENSATAAPTLEDGLKTGIKQAAGEADDQE